ncbi:MAG: SGNH/GDSL hydrolase family protein [Bacteroidetes bacterium]|nr:SGNH/GDSL hydrolase family protein [Bacteroidota bacterium]
MNTIEKQFSGIIAFGDGLTDMGRWGRLTDNKYPPASVGFLDGRWTNGSVWIEHFAKELDLELSLSNNYATGGATTGWFNINEPLKPVLHLDSTDQVLGLLAQVRTHLQTTPSINKKTLVVLWAGGHDIGNYLDYGFPNLEETTPANNYAQEFEMLYNAGARKFLVGNMPDMGLTPMYCGSENQQRATALCSDLNRSLSILQDKYKSKGCEVFMIDAKSLFSDAAMNPVKYGFKNVLDAYLPYNIIDFNNPLSDPSISIPNKEKGLNPDEFMSW